MKRVIADRNTEYHIITSRISHCGVLVIRVKYLYDILIIKNISFRWEGSHILVTVRHFLIRKSVIPYSIVIYIICCGIWINLLYLLIRITSDRNKHRNLGIRNAKAIVNHYSTHYYSIFPTISLINI